MNQPKWSPCEASLSAVGNQTQYDNPVKEALKGGKIVYGGFLMDPSVTTAVRLARQTHFVWIDAEHGPFTPESVLRIVQSFHLSTPAIPVVRIPTWDSTDLKPYLDTGVLGVVVPEIKTAEQVRSFMKRVKYPPQGERGFGPGRSTGWLSAPVMQEAIQRANDQVMVIVMIETPEAIENIEEIASVPGIDVLHIGPYDLSLKMGRLPMNDSKVQQAIAKVEQVARAHHIPLGAPTSSRADAIARAKHGYQFFTIPSEQEMIQKGLDAFMNPNTPVDGANSKFLPIQEKQVPAGMDYPVVQPPVEDPKLFAGKRIAILASHGVEETEIVFPYHYLAARGAEVDVVVPGWTSEGITVARFLKPTLWASATDAFLQAQAKKYDLLVLTGGAWNAQVVRGDEDALKLIMNHYRDGRPLAAICAGTSVLINAGIASGTRMTGSPAVAIDLINAGAKYVDEAAVIAGRLLTSRSPNDLLQFVDGIRKLLVEPPTKD